MKEETPKPNEQKEMLSFSLMKGCLNEQTSMAKIAPGKRFRMFSPRVGTPIYRAPELYKYGQIYSESIDLWGAGCCIYFMLVGLPPFPQASE